LSGFDRWRLVVRKGETDGGTVEVPHEALFRAWARLNTWLEPERSRLEVLRSLQVDATTWDRNGKNAGFLNHRDKRLAEAQDLSRNAGYARRLIQRDLDYLAACQAAARAARTQGRRRVLLGASGTVALILVILVGWFAYTRARLLPMFWDVTLTVLTAQDAQALKPDGAPFKECASCPKMIVVPAGSFMMGSDEFNDDQAPMHLVTIRQPFAVGIFEVTFDEWYACVAHGGCKHEPDDYFWGWGQLPVMNVSWDDAKQYVVWIAKLTGIPYRLLSEAEWEYAARGGTTTAYSWGDDIGIGNANCDGCGSRWDRKQTAPVGSFKSNAFGLYDMHGNVWEWAEDCWHNSYRDAPSEGSAWTTGCTDGSRRVVRGGSWFNGPLFLRAANRGWLSTDSRLGIIGFRLARTLSP
jgi:formylglycine-generating enzyme required for sulfatase activity